MRKAVLLSRLLALIFLFFTSGANAGVNVIRTIAGTGTFPPRSAPTDSVMATDGDLNTATGLCADTAGNVYYIESNFLRKMDASGMVVSIGGSLFSGFSGDGGPASAARFNSAQGIFTDRAGNIFIADRGNNRIRKISVSGIITTIAGTGTASYSGNGGAATAATLNAPNDVMADAAGNIFIADKGNNVIRKINTSGVITTVAGNNSAGFSGDGGAATSAALNGPTYVAVDASGNLYISDATNQRIRKVNTSGIISTIAGNGTAGFSGNGGAATAAKVNGPSGIRVDGSGNILFSDANNHCIRIINSSGIISDYAGMDSMGFSNDYQAATTAKISRPGALFIGANNQLIFNDAGNYRIRQITQCTALTTVAPITGAATLCIGATRVLSDTSTGGVWSSATPATATIDAGGTVTALRAGSPTISFTKINACGIGLATTSFTVNVAIPITATGVNTMCIGASGTITASGAVSYSWAPSTGLSATTGATVTATPAVTTTYTVSGISSNGCASRPDTQVVTVNAFTTLSAGGGSTVCKGSSATLTGGGGSTYTWYPATGLSATTGASVTATPSVATTYTVVGVDANGCTDSATATVSFTAVPTITGLSQLAAFTNNTITVTGNNFVTTVANNQVYFGAVRGTVIMSTPGSMLVKVPAEATYGPLSMVGCGNIAYSKGLYQPQFSDTNLQPMAIYANSPVNFTSGTNPQSSVIADVDSDGLADIIVANYGSNTVSVYRNLGTSGSISTSTFAAKVDFTTGTNPVAVKVADVNGDNKKDIIVVNYTSNTISVFRNTATTGAITTSSFAAKVDFATATNPRGIDVADFDRDGLTDIAVANTGANSISILKNTTPYRSAPTFATHVDFTTGTAPYSLIAGDMDGDNKTDVAVVNRTSNTVSVYRNTTTTGTINTGSFATAVDFATGTNPQAVVLADIDVDGKNDLAIANSTGNNISLLRNTATSGTISTGSFASRVDFTAGNSPVALAVADMNGDGKPELISANSADNKVSIFRNTSSTGAFSSGTLAAKVDFATGTTPYSVCAGDVDADGKPDLLTTNNGGANTSVLKGNLIYKIKGPRAICQGATGTYTDSTAGGTWSSSAASVATISTTGIVTARTVGMAIITYSAFGAMDTMLVTVGISPSLAVSPASASICNGAATALNATGGTTYSWAPATALNTTTGATVTATPTVNTTYTVTEVSTGCTATSALTVTAPISLSISASATSVCAGGTTTLSASGATSYVWAPAATLSATTGASVGAMPTSVTQYTVTGTVGSCSTSVTKLITMGTFPTISVTPNSASICPGSAVNATAIGATTYVWSPTTGLSASTGATVAISPSATVTYTVVGNTANPGCADTVFLPVTYISANKPVVTSLSPATGWPGATVTINGSNFNTSAPLNVVHFGGIAASVLGGTGSSLTVAAPLGATQYPVSVTDTGSGCGYTGFSPRAFIETFDNSRQYNLGLNYANAVLASATNTSCVSLVDLDGDLKNDIVAGNTTGATPNIGVFRNTSAPYSVSLASRTSLGSSAVPEYNTYADMDGDGMLDIIATNKNTATVSIYKNNSSSGTLSFGTAVTAATGTTPQGVVAGDINGDGLPDIVVCNYGSNTVSVFKNLGGPAGIAVATKIDLPADSNCLSVQLNDIDGDGKVDITTTNYNANTFSVYRNTSTAGGVSFATRQSFATGLRPFSHAVGDIDGDGKVDVVVTNNGANTVSFFRNTSTSGTVSFATRIDTSTGTGPKGVAIGDMNGDGKPDLAVANSTGTTISRYRNNSSAGSVAFNGKIDDAVSGSPVAVAIGDVDQDGRADIVAGCGTSLAVLRNNPFYPVTGPRSGCAGTTLTLSDSAAGGTWTSLNTAIATVSSSGVVTCLTAGSVVIRYSLNIYSDTAMLTVSPAPAAISISATATTICSGNSVTLTASGSSSYNWTPLTGFSGATGATISVSPAINSTYTVTGTDTNGCVASATKAITVNATPSLGYSGASSICQGASTSLRVLGAVTYVWSPASSLTASTGTVVSATPTITTTYTIVGTTSGCSASITRTLTVNAAPVLTVTPTSANICSGSSTSFTVAGATTYVWSPATGLSSVTAATVTASPTTSRTYTVTGTASGCSATRTATLNVSAPATATISAAPVPCDGTSVNVTFSGNAGDTIQYSVDSGSFNTAVLSGGSFSLSTGTMSAPHTYWLHNVYNLACSTNVDTSVTLNPTPDTWLGVASNNWSSAANWSCGMVPSVSQSVYIPAGTSYAPEVGASVLAYSRALTIDNGANITLQSGASLTATGNINNNGAVGGPGELIMAGSSAQYISGFGSVNNFNLDNTAGATISGLSRMLVKSVLAVTNGTLTTNDSLVLGSDSISTARVAALPAGAGVSGNVQVMQFIQGGMRRYRFWSHPFSNYIGLAQVQAGIDVTGTGGATNGFTPTASNAPSAFRYDPVTGNSSLGYDPGWKPFASTTTAIDSNRIHRHQGIRLFFRGTKGEGIGYGAYTPSSAIVKQLGTLNQGSQTVTLAKGSSSSQDYNMIGNPYAAPVDIGTVLYNARVSGNITGSAFYIWNPNLGAAGQYQAIAIGTGSPAPYYLPANCAFQVRAAHNGDSLNFIEAHKGTAPSASLLREAADGITLSVYDADFHLWDKLRINEVSNAADSEENYDARKLNGPDFNFYSLAPEGTPLSIDARPAIGIQPVQLAISSSFARDFILKADEMNISQSDPVYLHDKFTGQYVQLKQGAEYKFSITTQQATQGNRFEIGGKPEKARAEFKATVTPNPTTDKVTIRCSGTGNGSCTVRVIDLTGSVVAEREMVSVNGICTLSLNANPPGIYMIEVVAGSDKIVQKLIKE